MNAHKKEGLRALAALYGPKALKVALPILAVTVVYFQGRSEFEGLHPSAAMMLVSRVPAWQLAALVLLGMVAVLAMAGYDAIFRMGQRSTGTQMNWKPLLRASWIANTTNNVMGFGGFTGAGIRMLYYKRSGIPLGQQLQLLFLLSMSSLVGLSFLCTLSITGLLPVGSLMNEYPWLTAGVWLLSFYWPVYLILFSGMPLPFGGWLRKQGTISFRLAAGAGLVSLAEWLLAGVTFYASVSIVGLELSLPVVLGLFVLSAAAGILSLAPGGAGTLDLVLMVALSVNGAHPDHALAALLLFRVCYYAIPWIFGLFLAARDWMPRGEVLLGRTQDLWSKTNLGWQRVWMWPGQLAMLGDIGIWALSSLVLFSGLVLLVSAATPGILDRMLLLHHWVTPLTMKFSHQITVIMGLLLITLSRGIWHKLRRAYTLTLVMLGIGAFFSILKGLDVEEALFLSAVALLLYISRSRFYRRRWSYSRWSVVYWILLTACVAGAFYLLGDLLNPTPGHWLGRHKWAAAFFLKDRELLRSAVVGFAGTWVILTFWIWLSPKGTPHSPPNQEDYERLSELLARYPGNPLTHLLYLGDKSFFWSHAGDVLIPYGRYRNSLIVLGDPIGNPYGLKEALREFRTFADQWAMNPVLYQISARYLTLYHEFGYRFFKLGEEGFVSLQEFTLTGRSKADLRAVRNRYEREGYVLDMVEPPFTESLKESLRSISEQWLGERREKGFSLGWFEPDYMERAPVAVIRTAEGNAVAFATIMPGYDGSTASVDLVRFQPDAGNGIMDYLYMKLFEWAKGQGFTRFNLGMAPLSSVGEFPYAFREERLAGWVFRNVNAWYRFKGIRKYKEKFEPVWETRYLAYPQGSSLVTVMLNISLLIGRVRGKRRKATLTRSGGRSI
ncbi:bifunctional lysylphosphatidylglycerol flippase/synthetase MprF [Gorillibacterium sp. sgz5001074]|uniref:bifunctional lysylphosphatidylglycerol flippase/synthetase MprF n=1 Tax=Gorillibacterium sp. sgz5001074 TaxID=3446695 RepID=UPI003F676EC2